MKEFLLPALLGYLIGCINPAPLFMWFFKRKGQISQYKDLTAYNMTVSYGLVPGAVTGLVQFLVPQAIVFSVLILRYCDFQLATIMGCASIIGEVFPFYAPTKGDSGLFGYASAVLVGMIFVGPWVLIAAGFLAGSVNCMVLFVLTLTLAIPVLLACAQLPAAYLIVVTLTSVAVVLKNCLRILRVVQKREPKITDAIREVYRVIADIK